MAVQMYSQDNNEHLPRSKGWPVVLAPYTRDQTVFVCPSDDTPFVLSDSRRISFVWNDAYRAPNDGLTSPSGQPTSHISNASQTVLLADGTGAWWLSWELKDGIPVRFEESQFRLGGVVGRHNGLPNTLYCDGHVAAYPIWQTFGPRTQSGKSFFAGLSIEDD